MNTPVTLTVSQLNEYVRAVLDSTELLSDIYIKGEISNFTNHYKSGHFYFTLKDSAANLRAVMFRSYASQVPFEPENGMKITAHGRITVYEKEGVYQLYCDELIPDGVGALYLAFEQLKNKLSEEGLFDDDCKKPIPRFPQRIGIVTSPTGAAIADLMNILHRRYPLCEVELYPALVQGEGAPASLIDGLAHFDGKVDTIIIGRGGGSMEDLWCFNDERLARAVFACETPVISAVGHEVDFTICDFVSDLRAPTPSAAAELAVPDMKELKAQIADCGVRIRHSLESRFARCHERLDEIASRTAFSKPERQLEKKCEDLTNAEIDFADTWKRYCLAKRNALAQISSRLGALNPLGVLARGYAAAYKDGKAVTNASQLQTGDRLRLQFSEGQAYAVVDEIDT